ncbi:hypothetical protein FI667_g10798, partial [Globisporangium splendens]
MVQLTAFLTATALATLAFVTAHPGHPHHAIRTDAEVAHRKLFQTSAHRSLKACANSPHLRKLKEQTVARRAAKAEQLRQEQAARRRLSASTVLATSHKSNLTGVTTATDAATLFGTDPKCVLEPEVTQGPYYVSGEFIRTDIREEQAGIDLYAELQIIDVNSCTAVENLYVDFWHCNSTGVYSGVIASGNGNSADTTNIDKTFNRGLAPTDSSGIVSFATTFPGHYTGRATHIHVLGSHDGTVLANKTYSGGKAAHVGQIFFDQDLITEVEATSKYAVNTQSITLNSADTILSESAASGFDPVMEYVLLGDSVEDGIFAWISIGVDTTISKTVSAAATLTASGGVAASGTSGGMGGGNAPPTSGVSSTTSSNSTSTTSGNTTETSGSSGSSSTTVTSSASVAVSRASALSVAGLLAFLMLLQ